MVLSRISVVVSELSEIFKEPIVPFAMSLSVMIPSCSSRVPTEPAARLLSVMTLPPMSAAWRVPSLMGSNVVVWSKIFVGERVVRDLQRTNRAVGNVIVRDDAILQFKCANGTSSEVIVCDDVTTDVSG